jgi:hypothetical protein
MTESFTREEGKESGIAQHEREGRGKREGTLLDFLH